VSHRAIAAVLARSDLATGERLVALSLASFANREDRALPGNAAAAARAGLGRSRYLEARDQLVARGLVAIESAGRGRGRSTTLTVLFAKSGPWWDGETCHVARPSGRWSRANDVASWRTGKPPPEPSLSREQARPIHR
jgi:hypothetical protein